jgi:hypothetical protein
LLLLALGVAALVATLVDAARQDPARRAGRTASAGLVERLGLSDLALFTEARYTRHPSQADLHSPFQDHPLGLEHFPSGSLLPPPAHLTLLPERTLPE